MTCACVYVHISQNYSWQIAHIVTHLFWHLEYIYMLCEWACEWMNNEEWKLIELLHLCIYNFISKKKSKSEKFKFLKSHKDLCVWFQSLHFLFSRPSNVYFRNFKFEFWICLRHAMLMVKLMTMELSPFELNPINFILLSHLSSLIVIDWMCLIIINNLTIHQFIRSFFSFSQFLNFFT